FRSSRIHPIDRPPAKEGVFIRASVSRNLLLLDGPGEGDVLVNRDREAGSRLRDRHLVGDDVVCGEGGRGGLSPKRIMNREGGGSHESVNASSSCWSCRARERSSSSSVLTVMKKSWTGWPRVMINLPLRHCGLTGARNPV